MKTKKSLLTILAALIVTIGLATEKGKMYVIPVNDQKALIAFNSEAPTNFSVSIKNVQNEILYFYKSKKPEYLYRGNFNFSQLADGNYFVSVSYGNSNLNSQVTISNGSVKTSKVQHCMAPYFGQKNNKLDLSFINTAKAPVHLTIYKNGSHMENFNLGTALNIQKRFDLSQLEKGNYELVLSDRYNNHSFTVSR